MSWGPRADGAVGLFLCIFSNKKDRFQTLALFNTLKVIYTQEAAGREANLQENVKQFLINQKEKHKPGITEIAQQYRK